MIRAFALGLAAFALGIIGNLIAAWLQSEALGNRLTFPLVFSLLLLAFGLIGADILLQQQSVRRSSKTTKASARDSSPVEGFSTSLMQLFARIDIGTAFQLLAVLAGIVFLSRQIAGIESTGLFAWVWVWLCMTLPPFIIAVLLLPQEIKLRQGLTRDQNVSLSAEKLFGAFVSAFVGQTGAIVVLLFLDSYTGLWPLLSMPVRWIFWCIAGIGICLLSLAGTSVANHYWHGKTPEQQTMRASVGSIVLAFAFPFLVYPVLLLMMPVISPVLRDNTIGVSIFITALFVLGRSLIKNK